MKMKSSTEVANALGKKLLYFWRLFGMNSPKEGPV
jgi:hypothetical protein